MSEKNIKSRIVHKHDSEENWAKATSFVPMKGEIIVYDIDSNYNYERVKIGDGITNVNDLPFLIPSNLADIGNWTKIYDSGEITSEVNSISGINITDYKNLMVAIKCVNTTNSVGTRSGAVIFTGTNSQDYAFNNIFGNLIKNGTTTSGAFAKFKVIDDYIICENAMRAINAENMLADDEGVGFDQLTPLASGLIKCTTSISTMAVSTANQSDQHFYGVGSRVIVWGCKV